VATSGKIRSLRVRPSQSADLSFNMSGVLAARNFDPETKLGSAYLGRLVSAFDIANALYSKLGDTVPASGNIVDGARLKYDAGTISQVFEKSSGKTDAPFLFALRNASLSALLDQAVRRRENAFLDKYKHATAIENRLNASQTAIVDNLNDLLSREQERFDALDQAYKTDGISVRKKTLSRQSVSNDYKLKMATTTSVAALASWNSALKADVPSGSVMITDVKDSQGNVQQKHEVEDSATLPRLLQTDGSWKLPNNPFFDSQMTASETTSEGQQLVEGENVQYSHPPLENAVSHHQMVISTHAELIRQDLSAYRLPHTKQLLENELMAMDLDVRGLQLNFAHTYLFAPFSGLITAIYKEVGESVEPGEPIVRVENDEVILAVGQINFRDVIRVGMAVQLTTKDLFEGGQPVTIVGSIVSVRGHEVDDDEWDVIVEIENPEVKGQRLLPLNYGFDPDTTDISLG
jgi:hypothetical protein